MSKEERCKYYCEYNGDGLEDTDGCDYYSCELKNKLDREKYGSFSPLENRVEEDDECEICIFKEVIKDE